MSLFVVPVAMRHSVPRAGSPPGPVVGTQVSCAESNVLASSPSSTTTCASAGGSKTPDPAVALEDIRWHRTNSSEKAQISPERVLFSQVTRALCQPGGRGISAMARPDLPVGSAEVIAVGCAPAARRRRGTGPRPTRGGRRAAAAEASGLRGVMTMRRHHTTSLIPVLALFVLPAHAARVAYPCYQPDAAPVVDGNVSDDPAWSSMPAATGFSVLGDGFRPAGMTAPSTWQ